MTDDEKEDLRVATMQADLQLKKRQAFWETPRNVALIGAAIASLFAAGLGAAGVLGYKLGQREPIGTGTTIVVQPGATLVTQTPSAQRK